MVLRRSLLALASGLCLAALALAPAYGRAEEPLLTLRNPHLSGVYGTLTFTRSELERFAQKTITTSNDFVDGVRMFRGPRAYDVIERIGHTGLSMVRMTALNEYAVEIPLSDIEKYQPVLAMEIDGVALTIRDQGPIWLVYPTDSYPELQDAIYNNRMIWQLTDMELF